ncbi:non-canonical purine NTP pyrophosphatase, partial [Patescibacteria group bacterium]
IGTGNNGKICQIRKIFGWVGDKRVFKLFSLRDIRISDDVVEDQPTIAGNAIKKARSYVEKSNMITIADDFGISVDALNGFPGVRSKRWMKGSDEDRRLALLDMISHVPEKERSAKYIGVTVLICPDGREYFCQTEIQGRIIAPVALSESNFGYDPIFYDLKRKKTISQFDDREIYLYGHRGIGIRTVISEMIADNVCRKRSGK